MAARNTRLALFALAALAVAALVAFLCLRGCASKAPDDRTTDAAYAQELKDVMAARKPLVRARHQTVAEMEAVIARARQALPADATDEAVKAELEGHPDKYPEWKALNARIAGDNAAIEDSLRDAQARVRARIQKQFGPGAKPSAAAEAQAGKAK